MTSSKQMVLTIVVSQVNNNNFSGLIDQIVDTLYAANIETYSQTLLSSNQAINLVLPTTNAKTIRELVAEKQQEHSFDWCLQPVERRRKKLLVADMDSTMINVECVDELADFMGLKTKVAEITEKAMQGELDFRAALTERVALLEGMNIQVLEQCFNERVQYNQGAKALVRTMRHHGAVTALVSGGFTFFTERVSNDLGFMINRANQLEIKDDRLTGQIVPPISDANTKVESLMSLAKQYGHGTNLAVAIGDGANDIPMIEAAGLGIAYCAKEKARMAADATISHTSLRTVLYFQGYTDSEIIDD